MRLFFFLLSLVTIPLVLGCTNPKVKTRQYTSTDSLLSAKTVVIIEGRATCDNDELSEMYAVMDDTIVPVSRSLETDELQVTFAYEHKQLPKGYHNVRFYDEEGFFALRKAQSQGKQLDSVKSIFNVDVYHPGMWFSPWVQSETVALLASSVVGFVAIMTKIKFF